MNNENNKEYKCKKCKDRGYIGKYYIRGDVIYADPMVTPDKHKKYSNPISAPRLRCMHVKGDRMPFKQHDFSFAPTKVKQGAFKNPYNRPMAPSIRSKTRKKPKEITEV